MKKVEITVKVAYTVGLSEAEMPKKVYEQISEAYENGEEIEPMGAKGMKYPDASEWIRNNIKEDDCMDWTCEIQDFS